MKELARMLSKDGFKTTWENIKSDIGIEGVNDHPAHLKVLQSPVLGWMPDSHHQPSYNPKIYKTAAGSEQL